MADAPFKSRYGQLLRDFITSGEEQHLAAAAHLGREMMRAGVQFEEVAEIHHEGTIALAELVAEVRLAELAPRLSLPLVEVMMAYGLEFRRTQAERERMAVELRENEEKFRKITAAAHDGIVIVDESSHITYWNEAATRIFGYREAEALGQPLGEILVERRFEEAALEFVAAPSYTGRTNESRGRRRGGEEFPLEMSISSVQLKGRWHAIVIVRDISLRKQAEADMARFSTAMRVASDSVVITDMAGIVTDLNDAALALTEATQREELIGRPITSLATGEGQAALQQILTRLAHSGSVSATEIELLSLRGRRVLAELSASLMTDARRQPLGVVAMLRDIGERKAAEAREKAARAKVLQSANLAALGGLAAGVAHEMNNPLSAVLTYAHLLDEQLGELPVETLPLVEDFPTQLSHIRTAAERCKAIADNLLAFAREADAQMGWTCLATVVDRSLQLLGASRRMQRIQLSCEVPRIQVWGNAQALQRVCTNVLLNAFEAMNQFGALTVRAHEESGFATLEVSDNGTGISEEHLDKVFEPFFTTKAVGKNQGLGLAIAYGIVESHRGEISIDSLLGRGTTVRMRLPLRPPTSAGLQPPVFATR